MSAAPSIRAFCSPWHSTTSPAFDDMLAAPLTNVLDVQMTPWDEAARSEIAASSRACPLVFCQCLPPEELLQNAGARLVWIPMWDDLWQWTQADWDRLPKHLRVVAYCEALADVSERAWLTTLRVRYHKNPSGYAQATWHEGPVLFYWNRTGLLGPSMLERLCATFGARKLLFRSRTDPGISDRLRYELPGRLGGAEVVTIADWMPREQFADAVAEANVVVTPRVREGVGMVMLEAMARGCALIGLDAATMNEYIVHGRNGLLLPRAIETGAGRLARRATNRLRRGVGLTPVRFRERLAHRIDWAELARHDLCALGDQARTDQAAGFAAWQGQVADLARFLLEWP